MEIEQGIGTQRLKLLRMIAGLLMVIVFMSAAPFSSDCRRWFRGFIFSVLTRAEAAAQSLVIAQAIVLAHRRELSFTPFMPLDIAQKPDLNASRSVDPLPTLVSLSHRLRALRGVLMNLTRHGLRLLQRMSGAISSQRDSKPAAAPNLLLVWQLALKRVERPPIKPLHMHAKISSP